MINNLSKKLIRDAINYDIKNWYGDFKFQEPTRDKLRAVGNHVLRLYNPMYDGLGNKIPQNEVRAYVVEYLNKKMKKYGFVPVI